ncbi:putative gtp binding protein [Phaeoacremonium minimum UCRPA7]|uniref:Putative gtp binding protein n=1 Tax=Phaeoacremonium minimum (strain UCR-PA7) TaxID=1286976 RepID=R8BIT7_PHAM7|nr:putative gtp binding protein [Phaeoacremonium minimum UCRPA7]EON99235.1 putative gtp binding protein [Phaeoacremonium minimum UCRPA7]
MTPDAIEALFRRTEGSSVTPQSVDADEDEEVSITAQEREYRTGKLREVLLDAQTAWVSGSEEIDAIAEKLGDGSRDRFFLSIIANQDLRLPLKIHTLRLIGNSCADTDQNRALVLNANRLRDIINLLADDSILAFVIPVLYNILVDYEPAQLRACQAGLSNELIGILSGPRLENCRAFINIICKILALMITQEPEPKLASPATPIVLLRVAADYRSPVDLEDYSLLASVALSYLAHEDFQSYLLTTEGPWLVLNVFAESYTRFGDLASTLDPEEAAQLRTTQNAFVQVLSDLSALPTFLGFSGLASPVVQTLQSWLRQPSYFAAMQTAACLSLGNLARSDESSVAFVRDYQIHLPLISLLSNPYRSPTVSPTVDSPPPAQLLHAILSFLKNLAIPASNKPLLSPLFDSSILPRYWHLDSQPQTQFAAVSLTRLLLVGCPANVKRLCAPLSADPNSPAHDRSSLHVLSDLFDRIDAEPTKMEIARAIAAACRVLHSTPVLPILPDEWHVAEGRGEGYVFQPPKEGEGAGASASASASGPPPTSPDEDLGVLLSPGVGRRARFYDAHADISRPLSFLVRQTRFPALRSEAWFVLALMSRSPEGARVVVRAMQPFEACRALIEAITGRDMFDGHELLGASPPTSGPEMDSEFAAGMQRLRSGASSSGGVDMNNAVEQLGLEPQQVDPARAANMAKVDRENGLVLVAEVLKDHVLDLTPFRRSMFEELLRTGGELVIHQRAEDKDIAVS